MLPGSMNTPLGPGPKGYSVRNLMAATVRERRATGPDATGGRLGHHGGVILDRLDITAEEFHRGTGWEIKPEGACKVDVCVPLDQGAGFDLTTTAERLRMALVHDEAAGLWALGPESLGDRALVSAEAPELVLPDFDGNEFRLSSLRGQKVVLVSWAPY